MVEDNQIQKNNPPSDAPSHSPSPKVAGNESGADQDNQDLSWMEHLEELRARLTACIYAWIIMSIGGYLCSTQIIDFLKKPLMEVLPPDSQKLYFTNIFENFLMHIKISLYAGIVFASPYLLYQLWLFISPGLYRKEKKLVIPFILAGTFFFVGGTIFAYVYVFPAAFKFLLFYGNPEETIPLITVREYFGTTLKLLLAFGLSFEMPVLLVLLGFLGVINSEMLTKNRRWAVVIMSVACAFLSPPELFSMFLMMVPLYLFFESSIVVIRMIEKSRSKAK